MKVFKAEKVFESFVSGSGQAKRSPLLTHDSSVLYACYNRDLRNRQKAVAYKAWDHIFYDKDVPAQIYRLMKTVKNRVPLSAEDLSTLIINHSNISYWFVNGNGTRSSLVSFKKTLVTLNEIFDRAEVNIRFNPDSPTIQFDLLVVYKRMRSGYVSAWLADDLWSAEIEAISEMLEGEYAYIVTPMDGRSWMVIDSDDDDCLLRVMYPQCKNIRLSA